MIGKISKKPDARGYWYFQYKDSEGALRRVKNRDRAALDKQRSSMVANPLSMINNKVATRVIRDIWSKPIKKDLQSGEVLSMVGLKKLSKKHLDDGYKLICKYNYLKKPLCDYDVAWFTSGNLSAMSDWMAEDPDLTLSNQKKIWDVLGKIFGIAHRYEMIENNPIIGVQKNVYKRKLKQHKANQKPPDIVAGSPMDALELLAALKNNAYQKGRIFDYTWMEFAAETAVRVNESFAAEIKDINFDKQYIMIDKNLTYIYQEVGSVKSGKQREISLSDNLVKILKSWIKYMEVNGLKNPKGLLFPNTKGGYMSAGNFNNRNLTRAIKEIDPKLKITPHDFRNLNNSMNTLLGMPVEDRMQLLGHGDKKTNAIYNKEQGWINRQDKINQANNLSDLISLKNGANNLIGS